MRIGIDIDNVIAETVPVLLPKINKVFGLTLKYADIYMYDFHSILGISKSEMDECFWYKKGLIEKVFMGAKPVKGAQKAIKFLSKGNEVILVTDRPKRFMGVTRKWLAKWGIPYKEVRHIDGGMESKHTYVELRKINGTGFDVFVDDRLEDVILLSQYCKKVLLYRRPWNLTYNVNKSFFCVNNWEEIVKIITN